MHAQTTGQGCEVPAADRNRADAIAAKWPRFDPAVASARFIFRMEGRTRAVEAIVQRRRLEPVVAHAQAPDFRSALDELDERMKRILKKDRERRKAHHRLDPGPGR